MYLKTEGLVLRETEYLDADKLLSVLTKDHGLLTFRARGVRSKSSRLKSGCQLLAYSEFTVFESHGKYRVDEAVPIALFLPLREDIELLALASYAAQVAEVLSQEDCPGADLLLLCLHTLQAISDQKRPQEMIKAAFELRAACLAGYMPMLAECSVCGNPVPDRFHVSGGMLQCAGCLQPDDTGIRLPLQPGTLEAMRYVTACPIKRLFSFELGEHAQKQLGDIAETYLLTQLERGFFTLDFYKSLKLTYLRNTL